MTNGFTLVRRCTSGVTRTRNKKNKTDLSNKMVFWQTVCRDSVYGRFPLYYSPGGATNAPTVPPSSLLYDASVRNTIYTDGLRISFILFHFFFSFYFSLRAIRFVSFQMPANNACEQRNPVPHGINACTHTNFILMRLK